MYQNKQTEKLLSKFLALICNHKQTKTDEVVFFLFIVYCVELTDK